MASAADSPYNIRISVQTGIDVSNDACSATPSSVNDEQYFWVNVTISCVTPSTFSHQTVNMTQSSFVMEMKYDNSTHAFSILYGISYFALNTGTSKVVKVSSTQFIIEYYLEIHVGALQEGAYNCIVYSKTSYSFLQTKFTSVFTLTIRAPSAPSILWGDANTTFIYLAWTDNGTIQDGYTLSKTTYPYSSWTVLTNKTSAPYTYNYSSPIANIMYEFGVRAYRSTGVGYKYSSWAYDYEKTVTVIKNYVAPPVYNPVARFNETFRVEYGVAYLLDGSSTVDPNGYSITDYYWNFGDGYTADGGVYSTVTHSFASLGTLTLSLRVTDSQGHQNTFYNTVIVYWDNPVARFTATHDGTMGAWIVEVDKQVDFDASSSLSPNAGGSIILYHYDFGDGWSSGWTGSATQFHTYTVVGNYTFTLEVEDNLAYTNTCTFPIQVRDIFVNPVSRFNDTVRVLTGTGYKLDGSISVDPNVGGIDLYTWNFGDGNTTSGNYPTVTHIWGADGTYTISLKVRDLQSRTNTFYTTVISYTPLTNNPVAMFNSTLIANMTQSVLLDGSFSFDPDGASITNYQWSFGDGNVTSGSYPTIIHVWNAAGNYTVLANSYG